MVTLEHFPSLLTSGNDFQSKALSRILDNNSCNTEERMPFHNTGKLIPSTFECSVVFGVHWAWQKEESGQKSSGWQLEAFPSSFQGNTACAQQIAH